MGNGVDPEAILVPFDAGGAHGVLLIGGLDADGLLGVLPWWPVPELPCR
jgi:hypothetical protein